MDANILLYGNTNRAINMYHVEFKGVFGYIEARNHYRHHFKIEKEGAVYSYIGEN